MQRIFSAIFSISLLIHHVSSSLVSYNQPKLPSNAVWNTNGITIANEIVIGREPCGLFVNTNGIIYVASYSSHRVVQLNENGSCLRLIDTGLNNPTSLFVSLNGDIYVGNGYDGKHIDMWTTSGGSKNRVFSENAECLGVFIDRNDSIYCSAGYQHKVFKLIKSSSNYYETVAGIGLAGSTSEAFNGPRGIFIDTNFTLYVTDCYNNRVQRFSLGEKNGTAILGAGSSHSISVTCPHDVILDADGYLFVAVWSDNCIIGGSKDGYRCIVGCSLANGPGSHQLRNPTQLQFDKEGHLYVADKGNHRIQKYSLIASTENNKTDLSTSSMTSTVLSESIPTSKSLLTALTRKQTESSVSSNPTISSEYRTTFFRSIQLYPSDSFFPKMCPNTSLMMIGEQCDISQSPCHVVSTCQSDEECIEDPNVKFGYYCRCLLEDCDKTCSKQCVNGRCVGFGKNSKCQCVTGWIGDHCEQRNDLCQNHKCENGGKCFVVNDRPTCQCLGTNFYSGDRCEHVEQRLTVFRIVSKSFSYLAILIICVFVLFILVMDFLKYCLGIDPAKEDLEQIRMEKRRKRQRPVIEKFIYVNAPSENNNDNN